ncbi:hypothetical protein Goari_027218, partial [Gossypium aridum]|nr:hypothetical protein [Gossypium aridum]
MFAADSDQRQSRLRHELHSLKKGSMSIRDYVAKLKSVCALLESSGTSISMAERTAVLLAGLPSEFEGGFNEQCGGPNVGTHGWSRPSGEQRDFRPSNPGPQTGGPTDGFNGGFGMPSYLGSNVGPNIPPPMPTNPFVNNVKLDQANPTGNITVPWRTKPRARVFSASNPCFGLPKLGDIH